MKLSKKVIAMIAMASMVWGQTVPAAAFTWGSKTLSTTTVKEPVTTYSTKTYNFQSTTTYTAPSKTYTAPTPTYSAPKVTSTAPNRVSISPKIDTVPMPNKSKQMVDFNGDGLIKFAVPKRKLPGKTMIPGRVTRQNKASQMARQTMNTKTGVVNTQGLNSARTLIQKDGKIILGGTGYKVGYKVGKSSPLIQMKGVSKIPQKGNVAPPKTKTENAGSLAEDFTSAMETAKNSEAPTMDDLLAAFDKLGLAESKTPTGQKSSGIQQQESSQKTAPRAATQQKGDSSSGDSGGLRLIGKSSSKDNNGTSQPIREMFGLGNDALPGMTEDEILDRFAELRLFGVDIKNTDILNRVKEEGFDGIVNDRVREMFGFDKNDLKDNTIDEILDGMADLKMLGIDIKDPGVKDRIKEDGLDAVVEDETKNLFDQLEFSNNNQEPETSNQEPGTDTGSQTTDGNNDDYRDGVDWADPYPDDTGSGDSGDSGDGGGGSSGGGGGGEEPPPDENPPPDEEPIEPKGGDGVDELDPPDPSEPIITEEQADEGTPKDPPPEDNTEPCGDPCDDAADGKGMPKPDGADDTTGGGGFSSGKMDQDWLTQPSGEEADMEAPSWFRPMPELTAETFIGRYATPKPDGADTGGGGTGEGTSGRGSQPAPVDPGPDGEFSGLHSDPFKGDPVITGPDPRF
ncbi:MAG: hypothetical protein GWM98_08900 [Nitrospinaceae bacterium]|nr:hypothetical protein [Nitrospinaceae bacterium]NIR54580.1 hypothetical protein [Nitrospinaceae bacterium]NIS85002.1 hypothetical protein [Nitrospinaceae bacterium]NIT81813.1 hypothetical protein [Nitrospinaceae bacterium]NIU44076.1 hypothetical protein [Nitrospinaceae bacterium]